MAGRVHRYLKAQPDMAGPDATASADVVSNVVCGGTGRLRLTGHALPTGDGPVRAWVVFECGTLAADPAAGTLGFGILEIDGTTARPIRIGEDVARRAAAGRVTTTV